MLTYDTLYAALHTTLSGRASAFAAHTLLFHGRAEMNSNAREHTAEHGPQGSFLAQATLRQLQRYSREQLEEWVRLTNELRAAKLAAFEARYEVDKKTNALAAWLAKPLTAEEAKALAEKRLEDWWQREGRYEVELEELGQSKAFYSENEARAQFEKRPLSAREWTQK
jgi:hypothetical protein